VRQVDDRLVEWVLATVGANRLVSITGLRQGGSPWLFRFQASRGLDSAVLRVDDPEVAERHEREACGIALARTGGVPVANVIARSRDEHTALLLIEYVDGTSRQPVELDAARLATLGSVAARISAVDPGDALLPTVAHPIPLVDFDALRARSRPQPLLIAACEQVAAISPGDQVGFVHGDLWSGNTLWSGERLAAVIDWDCAGLGAPGIDLGSLRCDASMCYGLDAADHVLAGWEQETGRPLVSLAYWDAVAALSTPPEIDWFAGSIADMTGRPDLTKKLLRERRDAFLADALQRLG
jgi:aminoglycoside phosphotransferase (APT) family kinase protein